MGPLEYVEEGGTAVDADRRAMVKAYIEVI